MLIKDLNGDDSPELIYVESGGGEQVHWGEMHIYTMKTAQVKVSSSKSVNNKYVKNYKRIFTKANAGKKISIK